MLITTAQRAFVLPDGADAPAEVGKAETNDLVGACFTKTTKIAIARENSVLMIADASTREILQTMQFKGKKESLEFGSLYAPMQDALFSIKAVGRELSIVLLEGSKVIYTKCKLSACSSSCGCVI